MPAQNDEINIGDDISVELNAEPVEPEKIVTHTNTDDTSIAEAIARHFGVEPDAILGFALTAEYETPDGMSCSSAWSAITPAWRLRGFAAELAEHLRSL